MIKPFFRFVAVTGLLALAAGSQAVEGPPSSNGVISNPTLVANQDVAKAQAAGAISTFMNEGAKTCDANGQNCRSLFGADDTPDYTRLQQSSQALTGISSFSFLGQDGTDDGGDSNAVSSQMGTLALACGDTSVKKVAGIAVKLTACAVTASGDAKVTVQVCSAPMRGNPITPPENEVECSSDPAASNFRPPAGYVCKRPACDTQPEGSLDGWSSPQTISWMASLPTGATEDQKANNGLGLIFYPPLSGGAVANFKTDSDNMTAVKVVQTFINNETQRTAVGLKVAYRHKTQVTKAMMVQGPSAVVNPSENTAQWDTILKLQGNEQIPQYQQKYGANANECLTQITGGIGSDGKISVCDQNYTNESGIKPLAKTAQVAAEGQDCGTTPQCLKEVVNTTTWQEACSAEVPLAMRSCTTKQDYTMDSLSYTRTRTQEICHEQRTVAEYSCTTQSVLTGAVPKSCPAGTRLVNTASLHADGPWLDKYMLLRVTCQEQNRLRIQWATSVSGVEFDNHIVYGITHMSVDTTISLFAFQTSDWAPAGRVCIPPWDNGVTNLFKITCNAYQCSYTLKAQKGGSCPFSEYVLPQTTGVSDIQFEGVFGTLNECSTYENSR